MLRGGRGGGGSTTSHYYGTTPDSPIEPSTKLILINDRYFAAFWMTNANEFIIYVTIFFPRSAQ
jgi:hypothetical protein